MKKYYIAYGSNLNVKQMKFRCPAKVVGTSVIKDYQLLTKAARPYLTIERKGWHGTVAVWEVTADDEKGLMPMRVI